MHDKLLIRTTSQLFILYHNQMSLRLATVKPAGGAIFLAGMIKVGRGSVSTIVILHSNDHCQHTPKYPKLLQSHSATTSNYFTNYFKTIQEPFKNHSKTPPNSSKLLQTPWTAVPFLKLDTNTDISTREADDHDSLKKQVGKCRNGPHYQEGALGKVHPLAVG